MKPCFVTATRGDFGENAVSCHLSETGTEKAARWLWVGACEHKPIVVCVIVYCLLDPCGHGETKKDEEMAENGGCVATEATVARPEDEEQQKELYPNTVSTAINPVPRESGADE